MATDRAADRHLTPITPVRLDPSDLPERLDAAMGRRRRSWVISQLVARFLDGRPMPTLDELRAESDKSGQDYGE
jgi:hypothetical protein